MTSTSSILHPSIPTHIHMCIKLSYKHCHGHLGGCPCSCRAHLEDSGLELLATGSGRLKTRIPTWSQPCSKHLHGSHLPQPSIKAITPRPLQHTPSSHTPLVLSKPCAASSLHALSLCQPDRSDITSSVSNSTLLSISLTPAPAQATFSPTWTTSIPLPESPRPS